MFIYQGKLNWYGYAQDELFVVALPNGAVRLGDSAYLLFQWTQDNKNVKKPNWFQRLVVDKVAKTEDGGDTFHVTSGWYSWEITAKPTYDKLDIAMFSQNGGKSNLNVERVYKTQGLASKDPTRIWTGKLYWQQTATASKEPVTIIVPEGFGADKPVVAIWQWTKASNGKQKVPYILNGIQKDSQNNGNGAQNGKQNGSQSSGQTVQFALGDTTYELACTWDRATEKLDVQMKEQKKGAQHIGPFDLSAIITPHSHDLNPPEVPLPPAQLTVRYPQAKPSLDRIQSPMPFPLTLVDTLTHTASFLDQAGYLAKYAVERYTALDSKSHAQDKELSQRDIRISTLEKDLAKATAEVNLEKNKSKDLEEKFLTEQEKAAKKIQDLVKAIADDKKKDDKDAERFAETRKLLDVEYQTNAELQKKLTQAEIDLAGAKAQISLQATEISRLGDENRSLWNQLQLQADSYKKLQDQKDAADSDVKKLTGQLGDAQSELGALKKTSGEEKNQLEKENGGKDERIRMMDKWLHETTEERDSFKKSLKEANDENAKIRSQLDLAQAANNWHPENVGLFSAKQDVPSPLQQSIQKHEKNNTWARLSPWVGTMANSGTFFNSLDDTTRERTLKTLEIYGNDDWITAYKIEWDNGITKEYGNIKNGSLKQTIRQTPDQPIVAANIVTDRGSKYQTAANMALFGFDKKAGYHLVGEHNSPHKFGPWTKPVSQTSFAPTLDGNWALIGVYGYFDGCIDAVGLHLPSSLRRRMFSYKPISKANREIRLIRLAQSPGDEGIKLELRHASADDNVPYHAVSYVWGDPKDIGPVTVDEEELLVSQNLIALFRQLLKLEVTAWLWTDSICINQADLEEKAWQVGAMDQVYGNAELVYLWLGPGTLHTDKAMKMIHNHGRQIIVDMGWADPRNNQKNQKKKNKKLTKQLKKALSTGGKKPSSKAHQIVHFFYNLYNDPDLRHNNKDQPLDKYPLLDGLRDILKRPFWRRVWIVQEITLAKGALLLCGDEGMPLEYYCETINMLKQITRVFDEFSDSPFLQDLAQILFAATTLDARQDRQEGWQLTLPRILQGLGSLTGPRYLATDPRDLVFGLLSIVRERDSFGLRADYSEPVGRVFARATKAFLG
ncbi:hypothetical protein FDECE_3695 [Fusarium decemcellulare]|nr:hypothetical protein FDECE_3695 [Fusarium decemcellulare]